RIGVLQRLRIFRFLDRIVPQEGTMPRAVVEHAPVAAAARERPALDRVARLLERVEERPRLVGPRGEEVEVPASLFAVLADVVEHLRRGDGVAVVPYHRELTSQQAADL